MPRIVVPSPRLVVPAPRQRVRDARCSLWFDGVDDRITGVMPAVSGSGAWTLVSRINPADLSLSHRGIVYLGDGSGSGTATDLRQYGNVYRCVGSNAAWSVNGGSPRIGTWDRVVATFSGGIGGTIRFFQNGQQIGISGPVTPAIASGICMVGSLTAAGTYVTKGCLSDTRIYSRAWSPAEVAADNRGEDVSSANLVRWWKLEDGLGTTAHEEIGGTDDPVTGALPSPLVPFRRSRIVEDVPAAALGTGAVSCTVAHHADLDPAAGSFSLSLWTSARGVSGDIIASKDDGSKGWILDFTTGGALRLRLRDGATTITVTGTAILGSLWSGVGSWRTVTITCDRVGGFAYLSVDGGPPARTALGALGSIANTADLIFGAGASGFVGGLNDSWWWNGRALSWDERRALYFDGIVPAASGATRIGWAMRENTGTVVASSPSGYNGTLSADSHTPATRFKARVAVP